MQYEVSMTVCMGRIANQSTKMAAIEKQAIIIKYLTCIPEGYRCLCIPNMKLLCLILLLGEVCTDDANTNADAGRTMNKA